VTPFARPSAMRLPDPRSLESEFGRRGFVLVSDIFDERLMSDLFDLAMTLLRRHRIEVDRDGGEYGDGQRLRYGVVTGERIKAEGELLFSIYDHREMLTWIQTLTNSPAIGLSPHLRSAININCFWLVGQQYPWHRDAVPYTGLLFLTSMPPGAGGELLIRAVDGELVAIRPTAGDFVVMDGTRCPHAVAPLFQEGLRLSVPMVYPSKSVARPPGLDDYLYKCAVQRRDVNQSRFRTRSVKPRGAGRSGVSNYCNNKCGAA
jgi:hypothetical protein